jgi:hypothetical protein
LSLRIAASFPALQLDRPDFHSPLSFICGNRQFAPVVAADPLRYGRRRRLTFSGAFLPINQSPDPSLCRAHLSPPLAATDQSLQYLCVKFVATERTSTTTATVN